MYPHGYWFHYTVIIFYTPDSPTVIISPLIEKSVLSFYQALDSSWLTVELYSLLINKHTFHRPYSSLLTEVFSSVYWFPAAPAVPNIFNGRHSRDMIYAIVNFSEITYTLKNRCWTVEFTKNGPEPNTQVLHRVEMLGLNKFRNVSWYHFLWRVKSHYHSKGALKS